MENGFMLKKKLEEIQNVITIELSPKRKGK